MCSSASPALCHGIHRLFRTPVPRHRGDLGRLSRVVELAADRHRAGALPSRRLLGVGGRDDPLHLDQDGWLGREAARYE
jgi:hypothetical protein